MKNFSALMFAAVLILAPAPSQAAGKEGIAVIVNSDAITRSDVNDRLNMIAASTGIAKKPDMVEKIKPQIVDMLIDESLKMQEARALKIKVSKEEIDAGFGEIAKNNNMTPEEFKKIIERSGINFGTMQDQIKAELAWSKVIAAKVRPRIEVSDSDIDTELNKLKEKIGQTQFRVAQIYLPINDPKKEKEISAFAAKLAAQLREQPEAFGKAAQQFSQSPSAKKGGESGWMEKGQLPEEVDAVIDTLEPNAVSSPIKGQNAYYIVTLREKRQLSEDLLPKREDILQRVGLTRLERAARRYLMDLRATAFIENRV